MNKFEEVLKNTFRKREAKVAKQLASKVSLHFNLEMKKQTEIEQFSSGSVSASVSIFKGSDSAS